MAIKCVCLCVCKRKKNPDAIGKFVNNGFREIDSGRVNRWEVVFKNGLYKTFILSLKSVWDSWTEGDLVDS